MSFLKESWVNFATPLWEREAVQKLDEAARITDPDTGLPYDPPPNPLSQYMLWRNTWAPGTYSPHETVVDGSWTMTANKETTDRPAPQPVGDPFYVYAGPAMSVNIDSARQVIFGNRYVVNAGGWLAGYRINVAAGQFYRVFVISDPLGAKVVTEIATFTANLTGWAELSVDPVIVFPGVVFDLVAYVLDPPVAPVTFTGNWTYTTPQNASPPAAGEAVHANSTLGVISFNYIDGDAGDRTAELQTLNVGDSIEGPGGIEWLIQSSSDEGTYIVFGVSPAVQGSPDGVFLFSFNTTTPEPVTTFRTSNWWPGSGYTAEGLYGADIPYDDIVPNTDAQGTDIYVQPASVSQDWDIVAVSDIEGATSTPTPELEDMAQLNIRNDSILMLNNSVIAPYTWDAWFRHIIVDQVAGTMTVQRDGVYNVFIDVSGLATAANTENTFNIRVNGVIAFAIESTQKQVAEGVQANVSGMGRLTSGDVIDVYLTGDSDVTVEQAVFGLAYISPLTDITVLPPLP